MRSLTFSLPRLKRLLVVLATLSLALLIPSAISPPASQAAFPGTNGKIAFWSTRDGNGEVYVMNADGSGQINLSNHSANDLHPAWSADAAEITYASTRDGNGEIYVMNADGTNQTRLTTHSAEDFAPAWSPDGAQIAFTSERDIQEEVYKINADGTGTTNLTNHPANDQGADWSPDGATIAFTNNRDLCCSSDEIYVMDADGTNQTRLTNNSAHDLRPEWSPDGTKIAFDSNRDGNFEIYVMNADGTNQIRITTDLGADYSPAWSPDGTLIAFTSERDGNPEIYVMHADGTNQTRLTNNSAGDFDPDWQPLPPPTPTNTPTSTSTPTPTNTATPTSTPTPTNTPTPTQHDFYLHGTGPANNPPTLFLDTSPPAAITPKYKDSPSISFSGGNPWKDVGTWTAAPALANGTLISLSDLRAWLGLKNSDDQGTKFDLRAEVHKNGTLVASGETYCITGVTRNPALAKEVAVMFGSFAPTAYNGTTDELSLKVLARIGTDGSGGFCGGHSNAVGLRLYFDAVSRPAMFDGTFQP